MELLSINSFATSCDLEKAKADIIARIKSNALLEQNARQNVPGYGENTKVQFIKFEVGGFNQSESDDENAEMDAIVFVTYQSKVSGASNKSKNIITRYVGKFLFSHLANCLPQGDSTNVSPIK